MRNISLFILFNVFVGIRGWTADEFDKVKCGADIPKAMVGSHSSNERVVVIEGRHSDLRLKDLGGMEISGPLFLSSWRICGSEYAVLLNTRQQLVRDVLPVPAHSQLSPLAFVEPCQVARKEIHGAVIAILDNSQRRKPNASFEEISLSARLAWKIDERQERFVAMPIEGLSCAVRSSSADFKP